MATIDSCFSAFDRVMKQCVDHVGLRGHIFKEIDYPRDKLVIVFSIGFRYLSVQDCIYYEMFELDKKIVLEAAVKHLKDLKYQFDFYFEGIWG